MLRRLRTSQGHWEVEFKERKNYGKFSEIFGIF